MATLLRLYFNTQELEQRYNRFRVEVQTAVDRNELTATYANLARRVMSRETNATNAGSSGLAIKGSKAHKQAGTGSTRCQRSQGAFLKQLHEVVGNADLRYLALAGIYSRSAVQARASMTSLGLPSRGAMEQKLPVRQHPQATGLQQTQQQTKMTLNPASSAPECP